MCGIVGLINRTKQNFTTRDTELLEQLLIVDSLRGKDSVGVFNTYRNNQVEAIKLGSNVFNLLRCHEWAPFKERIQKRARFVIGHNRAATRGSVTTENAHPFAEDNIMLVHNGTLWNHEVLTTKNFEVDSQAIAHALSQSTPEKVLPSLMGAFALVWYDTTKKKLFAIRNKERPLCLIRTREMYVISSEPAIAAVPITRQDRKIESIDEIPPWTLFEFSMDGELQTREIEEYVTRVYHSNHHYHGNKYMDSIHEAIHEMDEDNTAGWGTDCCGDVTDDQVGGMVDAPFVEEGSTGTKTCALTSPSKNNDSDKNATGIKKSVQDLDAQAFNNTRQLHVAHETLQRGRLVLFKVIEIRPNEVSGQRQFRGKLHEAGELLYDVVGCFPEGTTLKELEAQWLGKYCMGRVHYVTESIGGISAYLVNTHLATMTTCFGNQRIPLAAWSIALSKCKCYKCNATIKGLDKDFTQINVRNLLENSSTDPRNDIQVMCADCIENTLTKQLKEEFIEKRNDVWQRAGYGSPYPNRNSSVQTGEQVGKGTSTTNGKSIELPGSETIQ